MQIRHKDTISEIICPFHIEKTIRTPQKIFRPIRTMPEKYSFTFRALSLSVYVSFIQDGCNSAPRW